MGPLGQCGSQHAHPLHSTNAGLGGHYQGDMVSWAFTTELPCRLKPPICLLPTAFLPQDKLCSNQSGLEWREWGAATSPQICLSTSPRGKSSCTASVTWATPTLSGVRLPQALTSMALCGGIQTHRTRSTSVSLLCDHVPIDSVTGN